MPIYDRVKVYEGPRADAAVMSSHLGKAGIPSEARRFPVHTEAYRRGSVRVLVDPDDAEVARDVLEGRILEEDQPIE